LAEHFQHDFLGPNLLFVHSLELMRMHENLYRGEGKTVSS
jgi:hypothetical protein